MSTLSTQSVLNYFRHQKYVSLYVYEILSIIKNGNHGRQQISLFYKLENVRLGYVFTIYFNNNAHYKNQEISKK